MRGRSGLLGLLVFVLFPGCAGDEGLGFASAGHDAELLDQRSDGVKYCGGGKYVEGIDVSHWQGAIDWNAVKSSGRAFAFMKATEGTGYVDDTFKKNWAASKAAGLIRGAYHFHRTNADPVAQAEHFVSTVGQLEAGDFPLMLDVEDANNPPSASAVTANVKACLEHIQKLTGRVPIIYTGNWYWSGYMANAAGFDKYPLWIAAYPSSWPNASYCPTVPGSWSKWVFWQYSSGGNGVPAVPGVGQSCDRNLFDGTLADLMAFVGGSAGEYYKATYVEQSWPLANADPIQLTVGETKTGYIKLKNAGTSTWKAGQVLLAPIPRDKPSAFQAASWASATRVSAVQNDVAPGDVGTFTWDLKGSETGDFSPYFSLVAEGITWFADAPKGGGPADEVIQVKIHVEPAPVDPGTGGAAGSGSEAGAGGEASAGSGTAGAGAGGSSAGVSGSSGQAGVAQAGTSSGGSAGKGGASGSGGKTQAAAGEEGTGDGVIVVKSANQGGDDGGCGCRTAGGSERAPGGLAAFGLLLLGALRRRGSRND